MVIDDDEMKRGAHVNALPLSNSGVSSLELTQQGHSSLHLPPEAERASLQPENEFPKRFSEINKFSVSLFILFLICKKNHPTRNFISLLCKFFSRFTKINKLVVYVTSCHTHIHARTNTRLHLKINLPRELFFIMSERHIQIVWLLG
jgi:hypothetical protein